MTTQAFKKSGWDKELATFKQSIYMNNDKIIEGYSKKEGFQERSDKTSMLTNWIIRMYMAGYLDQNNTARGPIKYIEYREIKSGEVIFRLYYKYCEWGENVFKRKNMSKLITFIDRFYELVTAGCSPAEIKAKLYDSTSKKSINQFDLDVKRFNTEMELVRYCHVLIHEKGADIGRVKHFFFSYKKKFEILSDQIKQPLVIELEHLFTKHK